MQKNILFLITKSEIGGAQRFVQEQLYILDRNKLRSYLLTNKPGWLSESSSYVKADFHLGIESKFSIGFFIFLCRYIIKNNIGLVVCSSANAGFYGRICAFILNRKSIYVSHGWSSIYNGGKLKSFYNFLESILSRLSQAVLCISENDYYLAINKIGIKKDKIQLISNSIIPLQHSSTLDESDVLKIVMVCRLDHPKRPDLLIEAVKQLGSKVKLTIVGDGPMMDKLQELVGIGESNICLVGEVKGFKDFYKFDVFALISESEGLPISALEAMSSRLALVLSNVGGCISLIDENGVLVGNDVSSIRDGIEKVRRNINSFKINSKNIFDDNHNLELKAPIYLDFYKKTLR